MQQLNVMKKQAPQKEGTNTIGHTKRGGKKQQKQ